MSTIAKALAVVAVVALALSAGLAAIVARAVDDDSFERFRTELRAWERASTTGDYSGTFLSEDTGTTSGESARHEAGPASGDGAVPVLDVLATSEHNGVSYQVTEVRSTLTGEGISIEVDLAIRNDGGHDVTLGERFALADYDGAADAGRGTVKPLGLEPVRVDRGAKQLVTLRFHVPEGELPGLKLLVMDDANEPAFRVRLDGGSHDSQS